MNYKESLDFIHSIPKFTRPLGNENLKKLLSALGNPHFGLKYIHIAGTNGKGSCAAMLMSILKESSYRVGMFTSPFIEVFNERIRINDVLISDSNLARITEKVKLAMEQNDAPVSEFAFITAVAFVYFCEQKCDYVVLETGMGGKLDATNVIENPIVSVLTSISLDHTQYLGETIEEITLEKCGIIKENCAVVSYPNTLVQEIIETEAEKKNSKLTFADGAVSEENGVRYNGRYYELSLKGDYQPYNAAVVLEIVNVLNKNGADINDDAVSDGLKNTKWPARFEFILPNVIIDGGHNEDGIQALVKSLNSLNKDVIAVMAMMEDKNYAPCICAIAKASKKVIATELKMERALSKEKIYETVMSQNTECEMSDSVGDAIKTALSQMKDNDVVCICGSLYLAGEARKILKKHHKEENI